ncbi:MAG: Mce-associated rane protein [Mycobacterium sp.]|jgi:Mce-associated membrane protein|nr:Mce-associated rane protein [Mycobacterium sp.]
MPSGKKLRTGNTEPDESQAAPEVTETTAEEPAAVEEPTSTAETAVEDPVEEPAAKTARKGRRNLLRRRKTEPDVVGGATESTEEAAEATDATEAAEPSEAERPADGDEPEREPVLVPHQPAGKRPKIAAAAAAVLFVAGGAFAGATAQPVIANRALVETKLDIARTAANAITTLWSYTPENMDSLADRSARYLTGDFAFQYRKFIDSIVATNKQAQVTNTTSVLGAAVESVNQSEAAAIVYTNSVATSPVSKNIPSLRYLSYRLEMKRDRSDWRITRMTTITTLDLTPQL